jgi:uncharacterized protein with HEPN domain
MKTPSTGEHFALTDMLTAALLANFFDAGWAIQVLVSDMDSHQYFASRLARPEIEKHLGTMIASAKALPPEVRAQMPMVDWPAWIALEDALPCTDETQRQRVWTAIENWLPPTGRHLRQYKQQMPELFVFRL